MAATKTRKIIRAVAFGTALAVAAAGGGAAYRLTQITNAHNRLLAVAKEKGVERLAEERRTQLFAERGLSEMPTGISRQAGW